MAGMLPAACLLVLAFVDVSRAQLLHETSLSSRLRSKVPESFKDGIENIGSLEEIDDNIDETDATKIKTDVTLANFLDGSLRSRWQAISKVGNRYDNRRRNMPMWDNITQQSVSDLKECFLDSNRRRMMDQDMWPYPNPADWSDVECGHRRRYDRRRASATPNFADVQPFAIDPPSTFVSSLYLEPGGRIGSLDPDEFNRRLQATTNPIVLRICPYCDAFYKTVYYRRFTYLNNFEAYDYFTCNWNPNMNVAGVDFKIYSTLMDALNDRNSWQSCSNASGLGVGFPGDCGNQSEFMLRPLGQWSSIPAGTCPFKQGGQTMVQFFILEATSDVLKRKPADPTSDQMLAWFRSELIPTTKPYFWKSFFNYFTASSSSQNGAAAQNAAGGFNAPGADYGGLSPTQDATIQGLLPLGQTSSGTLNPSLYGASSPLTFIKGSRNDALRFGTIITKNFSVCALTRYTGTGGITNTNFASYDNNDNLSSASNFSSVTGSSTVAQSYGRILQGSDTNWLLGHYMGSAGVAHFDIWATPAVRNLYSTKWLAICGTANEATTFVGGGMDMSPVALAQALTINTGGCPFCSTQTSNFGVAEVIAWNKTLNDTEVQQAIAYLNWKLEAGTQVQSLAYPASLASSDPQSLGFPPQLWYMSEKIQTSSWTSVSGDNTITSSSASGLRFNQASTCGSGFGAASCVNYLTGTTASALTLMSGLSGIFTICSVTRYLDSAAQKTILAGYNAKSSTDVYVHGHYSGNVGVAQYGGVWRTASSARNPGSLHWLVLCGSNGGGGVFDGIVDVSVPTYFPATGTPNSISIGVNKGGSWSASNFGLMELMVWNSQLSNSQMQQAAQYLLWKLQNFPTR